ncbi:MAG: hypothetical protein H6739_00570 [Alphaproteobacteria bacterium]|nr:hypothetical protein [Alphaproteobacteria bacterium]
MEDPGQLILVLGGVIWVVFWVRVGMKRNGGRLGSIEGSWDDIPLDPPLPRQLPAPFATLEAMLGAPRRVIPDDVDQPDTLVYTGRLAGFAVKAVVRPVGWQPGPMGLEVTVTLPEGLPPGSRVRSRSVLRDTLSRRPAVPLPEPLAEDFIAETATPGLTLWLLNHPPVRRGLLGFTADTLTLTEDTLQVESRFEPDAVVDDAFAVAQVQAAVRLAQALAERHGMRLRQLMGRLPSLQVDPAGEGLSGELEGVPVALDFRDGRVRVSARFGRPLPFELTLLRAERAPPRGSLLKPVAIGNPVLKLYVAAYALKPEAVAHILLDARLTEPALAVLHAYEGAEVSGAAVTIEVEGAPDVVAEEPLRRAVALALAFNQVVRDSARPPHDPASPDPA